MTDEYSAYRWLKKGWTGTHETVCHRTFEYARGDVHVNTAESSHALIKRGLTFKQYRTALAYFQESCGRRRLAEVDRRTLLDFRHFLAEREKRGGYVAAPSRLTNRLSGHGPLCRIEVITSESRTLGVPPNTLFRLFSSSGVLEAWSVNRDYNEDVDVSTSHSVAPQKA